MNDLHEIRRGALLAMCQLDAGREDEPETIRDGLAAGEVPDRLIEAAIALATDAWTARSASDQAIGELAVNWPIHRQPVVDRALLRLAFWEIRTQRVPHAVAIDEAVELARVFSTKDSPQFVNGVLDAYRKHLEGNGGTPLVPSQPDAEVG